MATLEEMLEEERFRFVCVESFVRQIFGRHLRELDPSPTKAEIDCHLDACKYYYETCGSKDGDISPWYNATRSFANEDIPE